MTRLKKTLVILDGLVLPISAWGIAVAYHLSTTNFTSLRTQPTSWLAFYATAFLYLGCSSATLYILNKKSLPMILGFLASGVLVVFIPYTGPGTLSSLFHVLFAYGNFILLNILVILSSISKHYSSNFYFFVLGLCAAFWIGFGSITGYLETTYLCGLGIYFALRLALTIPSKKRNSN